ncbi:MAG: hypothetical protein COB12_11540 [Flavobacterium sp.]|nr:MAG: hypothetical protein COB12_11540 [Flavobacterium sp.]
MNFTEAIILFKDHLKQTEIKPEVKVYSSFIAVLKDLQNRNLSEEELLDFENKLDDLKLETIPENKKKYLKKQLNILIQYSIKKLNLITEGTYIAIGLSLGTGLGLSLGIPILGSTNGVTYGMSFGMILGIIIGTILEQKAKKENRILNTNPK